MKILLAEDDILIAWMLEMTLIETGYEVLGPAATVDGALDITRHEIPDLALVDIHLRDGSNGIDLARVLQKQWAVPVLFASGQRSDALAHRDMAVGYLAKPFSVEALLASVRLVEHLLEKRPPPSPKAPRELELFG